MSAACRNENKRSRPSSAFTPLDGNVLGNENDKLIVDTTELQTKYNMLKGFNAELGKRYDNLKGFYTELQKKYDNLKGFSTELQKKHDNLKGFYFSMQERLQTEEVTRAKIQEELLQAKERLQQITQLHDQCHDSKEQITQLHDQCRDSKEALDLSKKKCSSLQDEVQQLKDQLERVTLEPITTDSNQIVNQQDVTPANNFVNSMTCFNSSCCPPSNDFLLQEIERLEDIVKKYEEKIHPTPLYCPGMIGLHPDGSEDPEARAIMKNALKLAEVLSVDDFRSLSKHFNGLNLKHRVGIETAVSDIAEKIDKLIPFSSEDDKVTIVRDISTCAARALVWKPEPTEECQDRELIDQSLRDAMKAAVRASRYYSSNPYAAESINKVIDELRIGAKLVIMVNKCPTFGGFSAACGGICPPGNELTDCASGKVFTALASALASSSDYRWNKLEVLGENFRFSCPLTPPPLGRYESCPDATKIELLTLIDLYTILVSGLCIAGVNMLLLSCAGITSKVHKKLISQVTVDEDIVEALLSQSQINRDDAPMNGQFVTCDEDSTRHLKCFTVFTSTTVDRQVDQMNLSIASMADRVEELAGIDKADEFAALAYGNKNLRFVTSNSTEIQALKTEYGHVEAAIATATETRKQKNADSKQEKAALLANRTEAEIEQEEQKKAETKLAANAIRRARYASRTAEEKEEANLKRRVSEQARLASMTVEEIEQARVKRNASEQERRDNRTADEIEQARLKKHASEQARLANRTADEIEQARQVVNQKYAEKQASMTVDEKEEARSRANTRRLLANSADCEHCGNPYPSRGKGTNHCCPYKIVQVGLECRQICQNTKIVEGVTMRCGSEKYKDKCTGYYRKFCGSEKCLTNNWFQL